MQCSRTILRLILEQCCYKDALAASNLHQIISHNTRGLKLSSNLLGPLFFYLGRVKLYFTVTSRVFITKTKIGSTPVVCGIPFSKNQHNSGLIHIWFLLEFVLYIRIYTLFQRKIKTKPICATSGSHRRHKESPNSRKLGKSWSDLNFCQKTIAKVHQG